jgi:hypothetical protein
MYKCPVRLLVSNSQLWRLLMFFSYPIVPLFPFHLAHRLSQGM